MSANPAFSGGGGVGRSNDHSVYSGGAAVQSQGNRGGSGTVKESAAFQAVSGGGGGAGGHGGDADPINNASGAGGAGVLCDITGESKWYGGGGGAFCYTGEDWQAFAGGSGGSGIVVVRYALAGNRATVICFR